MAQDRRYGGGARVDIGVDVQRPHQGDERRIVDQRDGHGAARLLRADRDKKVGLVVIRHGQHGIGAVDGCLKQDVHIHAVAVQHDGAFQAVGGAFGAGAVLFDDLAAHPVCPAFQRPGHAKAHIAATDDDDAFLFLGLFAKDFQRAVDVFGMGKDVDLIIGEQLIARIGGKEPTFAPHAHHDGAQGGKKIAQLAQGRVDDRAILIQLDAQEAGRGPA